LVPDNAAVLDTLGWILVQLGELERGLGYLREAVARDSRSPTHRYHLAVALEEYGNADEARRELERALEIGRPFPERAEALERLERLGATKVELTLE
jgi:tetratricopeptide (TPR) repeat protein